MRIKSNREPARLEEQLAELEKLAESNELRRKIS
jgi:hypothetical protein